MYIFMHGIPIKITSKIYLQIFHSGRIIKFPKFYEK